MKQICENCKYHYKEKVSDGYICVNTFSRHCADWTDKKDWCDKWEEKEHEND